ncbi:hypothetical protein BDN67DRAFT_105244 [Paxillus ammoniavirescens]|nr:hypothetical protein BDN67DRAFT_105244 [Paxillus ammoniavirescens]
MVTGCDNSSIKVLDASTGFTSTCNGMATPTSPGSRSHATVNSALGHGNMTTNQSSPSKFQHDSYVLSVDISPGDRYLASGGHGRKVRISHSCRFMMRSLLKKHKAVIRVDSNASPGNRGPHLKAGWSSKEDGHSFLSLQFQDMVLCSLTLCRGPSWKHTDK